MEDCAGAVGEAVEKRQDPSAEIAHPASLAMDLVGYYTAEREKRRAARGRGGEGGEDAEFVKTVQAKLDRPRCNRLSELPARGRGSYGAVGPKLTRRRGGDGRLQFRTETGEAEPPTGGLHVFLRIHRRSSGRAEKNDEVVSLREPALACLEALAQALGGLGGQRGGQTHVHVRGKGGGGLGGASSPAIPLLDESRRLHELGESVAL